MRPRTVPRPSPRSWWGAYCHRTSALRNELAQHPETASLALIHALSLDAFFESGGSCVEIFLKRTWLRSHAPDIEESLAELQIAERYAAWGKRPPEDSAKLWSFIHGLPETTGWLCLRIVFR
jgi:ParB family chromosome partitioning protein